MFLTKALFVHGPLMAHIPIIANNVVTDIFLISLNKQESMVTSNQAQRTKEPFIPSGCCMNLTSYVNALMSNGPFVNKLSPLLPPEKQLRVIYKQF